MNVGDFAAFLALIRSLARSLARNVRGLRTLVVRSAKVWRGSFAERGVQPIVEGHAGSARSSFGPLPDGWVDAVNTPRYARIHDSVRFRLRRPTPAPPAFPRVPVAKTIGFGAGRLPRKPTFSCYGK